MNQTILFTPVGGTDPISSTNCYDGSMLHICRHLKPDKVILYMSREMLEYQEEDDRYRYCLNKLAEMQNRKMEYQIIERRKLTKVHEFDYFYQDFREIFEKIYEDMDDTDTLLLNISSGTPAMKSGLLVLQTLGEFPAKLIQVATPLEKISEHIHRDYDVETLWEVDEDNRPDAKNRCKEVKCPTLSKIKKEELIKKHILAYDYQAALEVADTLSQEDIKDYRDLIELASNRLKLDFAGVDKIAKQKNFQCIPVRTSSERKYFEYALNLDIKLRKGEYADFIRAITPLVVDLFELVLKKQCGIVVDDYCHLVKRNGTEMRQWFKEKLNGTEVERILNQEYKMGFAAKDIYSIHLKILIDNYTDNLKLKDIVNDIRMVEEQIRNLAAHEILCVKEETIKELTGFSGKQIMDKIKELFTYTGIAVKKEYWNSYDEMNRMILERIS